MATDLGDQKVVNEDGSVNLYTSGRTYQDSKQHNPLNNFRSYTYNFTLSSISINNLNDPRKWQGLDLSPTRKENIILRSGGKGLFNKLKSNVSNADDLVNGFNNHSPGIYDMFIDDIEIDTLFQYSETSSASLPTQINFKVYEPYSVNGFLETLHIASVANGYSNYAHAFFLLKIEFIGYPDNKIEPKSYSADSEYVLNASRYFPITISKVDLDIDERGSIYTCTATPMNELAFGNTNNVKRDLKISGETVGEILENFMEVLSNTSKKDAEDTGLDVKFADEYEIRFPSIDPDNGKLDYSEGKENKIYKTLLLEPVLKSSSVLFDDPQTSKQNTNYKNNPEATPQLNMLTGKDYFTSQASSQSFGTMKKTINIPSTPEPLKAQPIYNPVNAPCVLQVPANSKIHEQISSIIRDSQYLPKIFKAVADNEKIDGQDAIDEYGFINYFIVQTNIEYGQELNPYTFLPKQKIIFIVSPYKVHAFNIPGAAQKIFDYSKYKGITKRTYNYLYTGKNVDILKFNLNFNSHFFQAIPSGINNETVPTKTVASPNGDTNVTASGGDVDAAKETQTPPAPLRSVHITTVPAEGGTGNIRSTSPYQHLSRLFHSALVNNVKSMSHGYIEIIGDPFYLVTGGIGNWEPGSTEIGITTTGEAEFRSGQVCIRINFRTPKDLGWPTMEFDEDVAPFSGIFMVNRVNNYFREGVFTQRVEIFRIPGQPDADKIEEPIEEENIYETEPNPVNDVQADTTDAVPPAAASDPSIEVKPGFAAKLSSLSERAKAGLTALANIGAAAANLNAIGANIAGVAGAALTNSLKNATGASQDASNPALSSVTSMGSNASSQVGGVGDKVSSAVTGSLANTGNTLKNAVTGAVDNVSATINGQVTQIKGQVTNLTDALKSKKIEIEVPKTVDLDAAKQQGIALDIIPADQLSNIPSTVPVNAQAPAAKPDTASLKELAKKGKDALAKAFGVKKVDNISPNAIPPAEFAKIQQSLPAVTPTNPLTGSNINVNTIDASVFNDKLASVSNLAGGSSNLASNALGSIPTTNSLANSASTPVGNFMNGSTSA